MEYRQLGETGLRVSKLCLGTMRGFVSENYENAKEIVHEAIDGGVNFVDTADCYGESEEVVGRVLAEENLRDEVVLTTKFGWYMGEGANDYGASRKHIIEACEASLRRLQTDYIDLYLLHVVDLNTPLEELLGAFDMLVKQGKVRYVGTSKHPAALLAEAVTISKYRGLVRFANEQSVYNILDRTLENELTWTAIRHGIGITVFSPLAGGILSGKYRPGKGAPEGSRLAGKEPGSDDRFTEEAVKAVEKLRPLAAARSVSVPQFSLAWVMQQPGITAPILGARKLKYIQEGIEACEIELTQEELDAVDEIVPPGGQVSNMYARNVYSPMRQNFRKEARNCGAYIPNQPPTPGFKGPESG
ncbi:MAG: aldo/keto reductase [Planctomycetes bacterium]|nr:aldo/keto reductase [Planctomycetota bacterium]